MITYADVVCVTGVCAVLGDDFYGICCAVVRVSKLLLSDLELITV